MSNRIVAEDVWTKVLCLELPWSFLKIHFYFSISISPFIVLYNIY